MVWVRLGFGVLGWVRLGQVVIGLFGMVSDILVSEVLRFERPISTTGHIKFISSACQDHAKVISGSGQCELNVMSSSFEGHIKLI